MTEMHAKRIRFGSQDYVRADVSDEVANALRELLDFIEIQDRHVTPAPKRESADDASSRDERDQVFGRLVLRAEAALSKAAQ